MSVIVRDDGFHYIADGSAESSNILYINPAEYDPELTFSDVDKIAVEFETFSDGRGFGIARELRDRGFTGTIQAKGHLIADQYAMARRVGFDEVIISDELAARQTEEQWLARSRWKAFDYQSRLGQEMDINNE